MGLFADEQDGALRFVARPDGIVKYQTRQHRDNGRRDVGRDARHINNRNRFAMGWQTENLADKIGHGVADQQARKHEIIARVGFQLVNFALQPHERRGRCCLVELAHFILDDVGQVRQ